MNLPKNITLIVQGISLKISAKLFNPCNANDQKYIGLQFKKIGQFDILDKRCNNKTINLIFKLKNVKDFNRGTAQRNADIIFKKTCFSFYLSCPVSPKVKETHFIIASALYPTADFLH